MNTQSIYRQRFDLHMLEKRQKMWQSIVDHEFTRYISPSDTVMDLGAGYCEFLHSITATKKIAVDINPDTKRFAGNTITILPYSVEKIPVKYSGNVNVVFMSHFLEHLPSKEMVLKVFNKIYSLLVKDGLCIIMGPNTDITGNNYWDFIDHTIALNGPSMIEGLKLSGFTIERFEKRFLPYTTKSKLPNHPILISLYLSLPSLIRPFAGQSLIVARK